MATLKYYNSDLASFIDVSKEFMDTLMKLGKDPSTRAVLSSARSWIDKAGSGKTPLKAKKLDELMNEYIKADSNTISTTGSALNANLISFDTFRNKIVGAFPTTPPELTAFLAAAEAGMETQISYRNALQFRSNANSVLGGREKNRQRNGGTESGILLQLRSFSPIFGAAMAG